MDYGAEIALNQFFKIRKDFAKRGDIRILGEEGGGMSPLS